MLMPFLIGFGIKLAKQKMVSPWLELGHRVLRRAEVVVKHN